MKLLLTFLVCFFVVKVDAQQSLKMSLLGNWNDTTLASQDNIFAKDKQTWSDLIGWTNPNTGKEYIIMGSIDSTYFFDVSDPTAIRKCAVYEGKTRSINRDYDVYKHYVYCVSDNGNPGALQVFDLQYLPDSVHLVWEDTTISQNTHSIFVDSASTRLYFHAAGVGFKRAYLLILSLENPERPTVIGELKDPACSFVHEAYYRNDTAYCSCGDNGLFVYDMTQSDHIVPLGNIKPPYPQNGYNHTSWLSDDGNYLVFTDEVPTGLPLKVYSIEPNKRNYDYITSFNSHTGATPHNVIWLGNKLWTSAYEDGMVLWDMTNPTSPKIEAFYDTYPQNAVGIYSGLTGCWGVYPFFKSGNIAASDMRNGLFMLKYNEVSGIRSTHQPELMVRVFPNPFSGEFTIRLHSDKNQPANISIYTINGQLIFEKQVDLTQGTNILKLDQLASIAKGLYLLNIVTATQLHHQRLVKE
jgi:choice-of-anchor B domain-containing protein